MRMTLLLLSAAAALSAAPAARLSSPVLGYVYDPAARAVRPLAGVPGAAALEAPIGSASKLTSGVVSPSQRHLLGVLLEGGVAVLDLASGASTLLKGAPNDVAVAAWSSDSRAVALWSQAGVLQIWTGLPDAPALRSSTAGVAVQDGGASALFWNDGGLWTTDSSAVRQVAPSGVVAAVFRAGSAEWVALTESQLLRSDGETRAHSVAKASAVAIAESGILIAGDKAVERISDTGSETISCDCRATSLERLTGHDVFRLTGSDAPSLVIFDGASSSEARILYVPTEGGR
jgi:hypothetical protein